MTIRAGDAAHDPVEWRGITLKQWFGSKRKASLDGGDIKKNEPSLRLTVTYLKGTPQTYDARIYMNQVECCVYGFDNPHAALNEANDRIQQLSAALCLKHE
jgi:hypothetical protein